MNIKSLVCLLAAGLLSSCATHHPKSESVPAGGAANQVSTPEGLLVIVSSDRTNLATGEEMHVKVSVINEGRAPITIPATSPTLVSLHLLRGDAGGWAQVRRYPEVSMNMLAPWTLGPGNWRTFEFNLKAEPDWPTGEPTRLAARVSGLPNLQPFVTLSVSVPR